MQNTFGVLLRNDNISPVGLYHTHSRVRLDTVREDDVMQTSVGGWAQNETEWTPWLRTLAGVRVDSYRFDVDQRVGRIARTFEVDHRDAAAIGGLGLGLRHDRIQPAVSHREWARAAIAAANGLDVAPS